MSELDAFDSSESAAAFDAWAEDEERDWGPDVGEEFEPEELSEPIVLPDGSTVTREDDPARYEEIVLARNNAQRHADRPDGYHELPPVEQAVAAPPTLVRRMSPAPVTVIAADGATTIGLGGNVDAVRVFIAERVDSEGSFTFERLIEPTPAGRLPEPEQRRRDELARLVAEARRADATLEAIAAATKRPLSTVHALGERGRALLGIAG